MLDHFFETYLKIEKAYRRFFQSEMEDYGLTPNELLVILFLAKRDKTLNTARDIAQHEGVSKGLVARSVEDLLAKGYLEVERDEVDRRICHLYLTPSGGGRPHHGEDIAPVYGKYYLCIKFPYITFVPSGKNSCIFANNTCTMRKHKVYA